MTILRGGLKASSVLLLVAGGLAATSGIPLVSMQLVVADEAPKDESSSLCCGSPEIGLPTQVHVLAVPGLMEGDASMDGEANIIDAMFISQFTVGLRDLDTYQLSCADTNDDGQVNIIDAMHLAQYTIDPNGDAGILFEPLWSSGPDDGMLSPDWSS